MAHPETEASNAPAGSGSAVEDILKLAGVEPEKEDADESEVDAEEAETDDEPEAEDEQSEEDDTEEEPLEAIDPPVSLNKEQKAAFAQLPPDLQKVWADTEAQRNREVQIKTTEAAEAKRTAMSQAKAEVAQLQRQYADELAIYADALKPGEPDYSLLATDPQAFAEQMAYHKQLSAQHDAIMQRVAEARYQYEGLSQEVQAELQHREMAVLQREMPEWFDPAKRAEIVPVLEAVGRELGYSDELMAQASASDILALKKAHAWKAKAEKYDALQARKMENVRAAKTLPKVAQPGVPSRVESKVRRADVAWERAKQTRSGEDYADFLKASGISL